MTALAVLSVIDTLFILLLLIRTGRIIANQNDQADAFVSTHNFQNQKLCDLGNTIESAMDCLLIADYTAASSAGDDAR